MRNINLLFVIPIFCIGLPLGINPEARATTPKTKSEKSMTETGPRTIPAPSDVAAPPRDASKTPSGLACKVLKKGNGKRKPTPQNTVEVHYTGWTTDGNMFDSSVVRGQPATFPLNGVIRGWTEGVSMMVEGEKRRLWIPAELAYGNSPGKPQGMLVFDVELLRIVP